MAFAWQPERSVPQASFSPFSQKESLGKTVRGIQLEQVESELETGGSPGKAFDPLPLELELERHEF